MHTHRRNSGFTLVEILIVVVILGILAAIVVPQFASASEDAIKGALRSQMQTISAQIELYRVQNAGQLPHQDPGSALGGADHNGWGVLVEENFLKDEPRNGYTNSNTVATQAGAGGAAVAGMLAQGDRPLAGGASTGWFYSESLGKIAANGYDNANHALSHEADYVIPTW